VRFHGLVADLECGRDLAIRPAERKMAKHVDFAPGEALLRRTCTHQRTD
jgi:hypothetical protein